MLIKTQQLLTSFLCSPYPKAGKCRAAFCGVNFQSLSQWEWRKFSQHPQPLRDTAERPGISGGGNRAAPLTSAGEGSLTETPPENPTATIQGLCPGISRRIRLSARADIALLVPWLETLGAAPGISGHTQARDFGMMNLLLSGP